MYTSNRKMSGRGSKMAAEPGRAIGHGELGARVGRLVHAGPLSFHAGPPRSRTCAPAPLVTSTPCPSAAWLRTPPRLQAPLECRGSFLACSILHHLSTFFLLPSFPSFLGVFKGPRSNDLYFSHTFGDIVQPVRDGIFSTPFLKTPHNVQGERE
jgi:hypothetical protein